MSQTQRPAGATIPPVANHPGAPPLGPIGGGLAGSVPWKCGEGAEEGTAEYGEAGRSALAATDLCHGLPTYSSLQQATPAPADQVPNSPIHQAVWNDRIPIELFHFRPRPLAEAAAAAMQRSLGIVERHKRAGTLYDEQGKLAEQLLGDLGTAGYWGLLIDPQYGGSGAPFSGFAPFLTQMAQANASVAALGAVQGCLGAAGAIGAFGSDEQKQRFLPDLASGRRLSAFALTEPAAGSDITALRTRAERMGDEYVVSGEKRFITNAAAGRTIALVCLVEGRPEVLVVELPTRETSDFRLKEYPLHALRHIWNRGIELRNFRVPRENLLAAPSGDGLTIVYHGLNRSRVALCATSAGKMRRMLANMLPWARFRRTHGAAIGSRGLVRRRIARLAGLIVACDALMHWCAGVLDAGYRGELECMVAKVFGSEAQKEAAVELFMRTHGGRAFLAGHLFGDYVHDYLAPCIYEGEGELLNLAFFRSLSRQHAAQFFDPIDRAAEAAGIDGALPWRWRDAWRIRATLKPYGRWLIQQRFRHSTRPELPMLPPNLREHAEYAADFLQTSSREVSRALRKDRLAAADGQCRKNECAARLQTAVVILCTSLYAGIQQDEGIRAAGSLVCHDLRRQLEGKRPSDRDFERSSRLAELVLAGHFRPIAGIEPEPIFMPYEQRSSGE